MVTTQLLSLLVFMHNRVQSIAHSHFVVLFGHLANQQAINDWALVETGCNISSFGIYIVDPYFLSKLV